MEICPCGNGRHYITYSFILFISTEIDTGIDTEVKTIHFKVSLSLSLYVYIYIHIDGSVVQLVSNMLLESLDRWVTFE